MEKQLWCFLVLISFSNDFGQSGRGYLGLCQRFDLNDEGEVRGTSSLDECVCVCVCVCVCARARAHN